MQLLRALKKAGDTNPSASITVNEEGIVVENESTERSLDRPRRLN